MRVDANRTCFFGVTGLTLLILGLAFCRVARERAGPPAASPAAIVTPRKPSPAAAAGPPRRFARGNPPEPVREEAEMGVGEKGRGYGAGPIDHAHRRRTSAVRESIAFDHPNPPRHESLQGHGGPDA